MVVVGALYRLQNNKFLRVLPVLPLRVLHALRRLPMLRRLNHRHRHLCMVTNPMVTSASKTRMKTTRSFHPALFFRVQLKRNHRLLPATLILPYFSQAIGVTGQNRFWKVTFVIISRRLAMGRRQLRSSNTPCSLFFNFKVNCPRKIDFPLRNPWTPHPSPPHRLLLCPLTRSLTLAA